MGLLDSLFGFMNMMKQPGGGTGTPTTQAPAVPQGTQMTPNPQPQTEGMEWAPQQPQMSAAGPISTGSLPPASTNTLSGIGHQIQNGGKLPGSGILSKTGNMQVPGMNGSIAQNLVPMLAKIMGVAAL